jgi:hypothetical protein
VVVGECVAVKEQDTVTLARQQHGGWRPLTAGTDDDHIVHMRTFAHFGRPKHADTQL